MARVLLAWELGANLGHVAPMRALARALQRRGHECVFAACDLRSAEEFIEPELGPVLQAPVRIGGSRNPVRTQVSYASLLNNSGFDDIVGLAGRIRAWRTLFETIRPQLLICDHSPTALLAAHSLGLARANVGTGFFVPPTIRPFPVFHPGLQASVEVLAHNETAVTQNINQALARLKLPPLTCLQDIFSGSQAGILSYRELDHYQCQRTEPFLGVPETAHGADPVWPAGAGPRILAYLRPLKNLQPILAALARSRARVLLRVGDLSASALQPYIRPGLMATDQLIHMQRAAESCDAYVNYASHGVMAEMLLAGKPGLLIPDLMERSLVARRAEQLGAAIVPPEQGSFNLSTAFERIIEDPALRSAAGDFAGRYRGHDRQAIPDQLAERLLVPLSAA